MQCVIDNLSILVLLFSCCACGFAVFLSSVSLLVFQYACMQLINAIVTTPDDLDFRLHLRNEFMRTGLYDALEVGKQCCQPKYLRYTTVDSFYMELLRLRAS